MSGRKTTGATWRETTVLIRSDIYAQAEERHIDISDACNRALASLLNIEYRRPHAPPSADEPAIIVPAGAVPERTNPQVLKAPARVLPPVINAEDPTVPAKVLRERKRPASPVLPAGVPSPSAPKIPQKPVVAEVPAPSPAQSQMPKTGKKPKSDAIKKFVGVKIVRMHEENPDAIIAKDELYQIFVRWCQDHGFAPVPDHRAFTVALKNRYAIAERNVGNKPSWVGIHVK
jgi:hypothetical protein